MKLWCPNRYLSFLKGIWSLRNKPLQMQTSPNSSVSKFQFSLYQFISVYELLHFETAAVAKLLMFFRFYFQVLVCDDIGYWEQSTLSFQCKLISWKLQNKFQFLVIFLKKLAFSAFWDSQCRQIIDFFQVFFPDLGS